MAYLSNIEKILANWLGAGVTEDAPHSRVEDLLIQIRDGGGTGGTTDYTELENKPAINSVTLVGNKSLDDLGVINAITMEIAKIIAEAPESFNTLKEISDWIYTHEDSAAAMNSAIVDLQNGKVDKVSGKGLSTNDYTNAEKSSLETLNTTVADLEADLGGVSIVECTQAENDAMVSHDEHTLYIVSPTTGGV